MSPLPEAGEGTGYALARMSAPNPPADKLSALQEIEQPSYLTEVHWTHAAAPASPPDSHWRQRWQLKRAGTTVDSNPSVADKSSSLFSQEETQCDPSCKHDNQRQRTEATLLDY